MTKSKISTYQKLIKINEENLKMGKNKLPVNVKKIRGTYRASRHIVSGHLSGGIPEKPSNMTPGAGKYWDILINRLSLIGSLDVCDDLSLSILAESLAEFEKMTQFLNTNGMTYSFENSKGEVSQRPRPETKIRDAAWSRIYPLLKEYGLTFKSRADIVPGTLQKTPSVWGALRK